MSGSSFNGLFEKNGSFKIHQKNVPSLVIEIYKYLQGLFPTILGEVSKINEIIPYVVRCAIWYPLYNLKNVKNPLYNLKNLKN